MTPEQPTLREQRRLKHAERAEAQAHAQAHRPSQEVADDAERPHWLRTAVDAADPRLDVFRNLKARARARPACRSASTSQRWWWLRRLRAHSSSDRTAGAARRTQSSSSAGAYLLQRGPRCCCSCSRGTAAGARARSRRGVVCAARLESARLARGRSGLRVHSMLLKESVAQRLLPQLAAAHAAGAAFDVFVAAPAVLRAVVGYPVRGALAAGWVPPGRDDTWLAANIVAPLRAAPSQPLRCLAVEASCDVGNVGCAGDRSRGRARSCRR